MFSDLLKELRAKKGISQTDLASAIGVSPGNVGDWERGKAKPGYDALTALTRFFEISADYLLTGNAHISPLDLNEDERDLLARYKALDDDGKKCVIVEAIHQAQRMDRKIDKKITSSSFRENGTGDNITA